MQSFLYDNIKKLTYEFPYVPVLDYYNDVWFTEEYFMNDIGKEMFANIMFKNINTIFQEE